MSNWASARHRPDLVHAKVQTSGKGMIGQGHQPSGPASAKHFPARHRRAAEGVRACRFLGASAPQTAWADPLPACKKFSLYGLFSASAHGGERFLCGRRSYGYPPILGDSFASSRDLCGGAFSQNCIRRRPPRAHFQFRATVRAPTLARRALRTANSAFAVRYLIQVMRPAPVARRGDECLA